ncbi:MULTISPECIES: hypothetical protein [unclassified Corynebacterium]|uniref:hypothetical protein n=1 Tax=unclassified Corynebacterium TaxID=2624378 RepID=UPI00216A3553|nr:MULTISPECIES: hypothetical protein [unclassified Corynebacterium]MCS4489079.1 hypothetical protein [Corynebacterium sp. ES2775-CONJ]MCS4531225.1 hypothetical protein [Corynebacterium sp. ES2730-CONJ]
MTNRAVTTDLSVLMDPLTLDQLVADLPVALKSHGYTVRAIHSEAVTMSCEPENMLVSEYEQREGRVPLVEVLFRVLIHGSTKLDLKAATQAVSSSFPPQTYWYGTSVEGSVNPHIDAICQFKTEES